jgi:hypothetical protein
MYAKPVPSLSALAGVPAMRAAAVICLTGRHPVVGSNARWAQLQGRGRVGAVSMW